jgi:transposase
LPERAPGALVADKAYDSDAIRDDLKQRGIRAVTPPKSNRTKTICYSKRLYRQRNCIERVLGHLKINRAIATRYDQLADSFLGMLYLATARYWIKFVHAPRARAASGISRSVAPAVVAFAGLTSTAIRTALGTKSYKIRSRLATNSAVKY